MAINPARRFAAVAIGQGLSGLGSSMLGFGFGVFVFESTDSAAAYGSVLTAGAVGGVLGRAAVGGMVDRLPRRRLLIGFDSVSALVSVLVLFVAAGLWNGLYAVAAISFVGGMAGSGHGVTLSAVIPSLVHKDKLLSANATLALFGGLIGIVAPTLGALVYSEFALEGLVAIDLASFAFAITVIALISIPPTPPTAVQSHAVLANLRFGARWIGRHKALRNLLSFTVAGNVAGSTVIALAAPLVLTTHDEHALGMLLAAGAVGSIGGALLAMRISIVNQQRTYLLLAALRVLALAAVAAGRAPAYYNAGAFVVFFASSISQTLNNTNWQSRTPSEFRGRVFAVRTAVAAAITPITYMSAGTLAEWLRDSHITEGAAWPDVLAIVVGTGDDAAYAVGFLLASALLAVVVAITGFTRGLSGLDEGPS